MEVVPVFRAPKRRKIIQTSQTSQQSDENAGHQEIDVNEATSFDNDGEQGNLLRSVVRASKSRRMPKSGMTFSNTTAKVPENDSPLALIQPNSSREGFKDMSNRFVSSTGQVVDVDKHMVSYIESQIARQQERHNTTQSISKAQGIQTQANEGLTRQHSDRASAQREDTKPNSTNPLSEVDIEPTQPRAENQSGQPPRKPRLGRDGKPFRPRPRKRRNSEDIVRDALVESVLHERKLENVYQPPISNYGLGTRSEDDDDETGEHDEVFAEKFRQEFLDQVAEKKQGQQMKQKTAGAGTDKGQGPKLGGSRSARAKMMQQQQGQSGGRG